MKFNVLREVEIEVCFCRIKLNLSEEEDIPPRLPLLLDGQWCAVVHLESGKILDWDIGFACDLFVKACDAGTYQLLGPTMEVLASIEQDYVPNDIIPGDYGDYVDLHISQDGTILNWPKNPDVSAFFRTEST